MCDEQKHEMIDPLLSLMLSFFLLGYTPKDITERLEQLEEESNDEPRQLDKHQLVDA